MCLRDGEKIVLALVVVSFLVATWFYPQMPDKVVSHWNAQGQPDGFMGKLWGTFLMPAVLLLMGLLFLAIPRIDPLKENIRKFRNYYDGFIILLLVFMLGIQAQTILWNIGVPVDFALTIPLGLGVLFYGVGILLEKSKRNWFIGIRTPWTMSSDGVWDKTHELGGKLFKACGALSILGGILAGNNSFWFAVIPVLAASIFLVYYSYAEFRKEKKKAGKGKRQKREK